MSVEVECGASNFRHRSDLDRSRSISTAGNRAAAGVVGAAMRAAPLAVASLALLALGAASCSDSDDDGGVGDEATTTAPPDDDGDDTGGGSGEGTISVRLEPTDAIFIEGVEVGLRFTDATTGEEIERVVWSDVVAEQEPAAGADPFYDAEYEIAVPAGAVRVGSDVNLGIGPPPEPPDLDANPMPCELDVDVADGETVVVEVAFDDAGDECLRIVEGTVD
jgi:hypothetical protein